MNRFVCIVVVTFFLGGWLGSQVPEPPTDGSVGPVWRSPDGTSWAAVSRENAPGELNVSLLVNGVPYGKYRQVDPPVWAPAGKRWYARVELAKQSRGVLVDGKLWGPYQNLQEPVFDATGVHLSFAMNRDGNSYVWQDGKEQGVYQSTGVIRRPDGYSFGAWGTSKTNKTTLFVAGQTWGPYDWVNTNLDWIGADGSSYLTRVTKGGVSYLLQDGKENRRDNLNFERAPGGGYWLSWGKSEGWMYTINGQTVGPYTMPPVGWGGGGPYFFEDGKSWAMSTLVAGSDGQVNASQVILNGKITLPGWNVAKIRDKQGEAFTWFEGGQTTDLVASRYDGKSTSARTLYGLSQESEGWMLQVSGKTLGPYQTLGRPVVLPEGNHWAVIAQLPEGRFRVVADGIEGVVSPAGVGAESLTIDATGRHVTYHLRLHNNDLQAYQITDDKVTGPFARAGVPQFSTNGQHSMLWSEPTKVGSAVLTFDGKTYGPFTGMRGGDRQYFDLENGHFVFQNKEKSGMMAITDQGNFGPYEEVYPLATGHRVGNNLSGLLWAFVGRLKGGKAELHVFSGFPGGGKTYPGVQLPSEGDNDVTPDGQSWTYPLAPPQGGQLRNGDHLN